jgi:hypothetical protein
VFLFSLIDHILSVFVQKTTSLDKDDEKSSGSFVFTSSNTTLFQELPTDVSNCVYTRNFLFSLRPVLFLTHFWSLLSQNVIFIIWSFSFPFRFKSNSVVPNEEAINLMKSFGIWSDGSTATGTKKKTTKTLTSPFFLFTHFILLWIVLWLECVVWTNCHLVRTHTNSTSITNTTISTTKTTATRHYSSIAVTGTQCTTLSYQKEFGCLQIEVFLNKNKWTQRVGKIKWGRNCSQCAYSVILSYSQTCTFLSFLSHSSLTVLLWCILATFYTHTLSLFLILFHF